MYLNEEKDLKSYTDLSKKSWVFTAVWVTVVVAGLLYLQYYYNYRISLIGENLHPSSNLLNYAHAFSLRISQLSMLYIGLFAFVVSTGGTILNSIVRDLVFRVIGERSEVDYVIQYQELEGKKYTSQLRLILTVVVAFTLIFFIIDSPTLDSETLSDGIFYISVAASLHYWYFVFKKARHFNLGFDRGIKYATHYLINLSNALQFLVLIGAFYFSFYIVFPYCSKHQSNIEIENLEYFKTYRTDLNVYEDFQRDKAQAYSTLNSAIGIEEILYQGLKISISDHPVVQPNTSALNIRMGPSIYSSIILTASDNDQFQVINDYKGEWYKVMVGSETGWVSAKYVSKVANTGESNSSYLIRALFKSIIVLGIGFVIIPVIINTLNVGLIVTSILTLASSLLAEVIERTIITRFPEIQSQTLVLIGISFIVSLIITLVFTRTNKE